jgi:hypothetical protein
MERALELYVAIQLTVIGLSHILYPRAWVEFFIWLRGKGQAGALANGFLSLAMGSMIVAFHPVWSGLPMVVTIFGVLNLIKAAQCFLLPAISMRSMGRVSLERSREFVAAGIVALIMAAVTTLAFVRGA